LEKKYFVWNVIGRSQWAIPKNKCTFKFIYFGEYVEPVGNPQELVHFSNSGFGE